jgi:AcrR family transcriptional regulator
VAFGPSPDAVTPPRTARGARTSNRLRRAALEVFAERGYATTRIEDIVARAGVSHGTFYLYYPNKSAVLEALIDETAAQLRAVVDEPWTGPDTRSAIARVIGRFVEVYADNATLVRVWLDAGAHDERFRGRLREVRAEYVARVASALEPVLRDTPHEPQVAAAALVAMVEGYATRTEHADDPRRHRAAVKTLSALWFGGLLQLTDEGAPTG